MSTAVLFHSQFVGGVEDIVLPNNLIFTFSEAYLPPKLNNKDTLAFPFNVSH